MFETETRQSKMRMNPRRDRDPQKVVSSRDQDRSQVAASPADEGWRLRPNESDLNNLEKHREREREYGGNEGGLA